MVIRRRQARPEPVAPAPAAAPVPPPAYPYPQPAALGQGDLAADARLYADRHAMVADLVRPGSVMAEVGVGLGDFSAFLLETTAPTSFLGIDIFTLHQLDYLWGRPTSELFGGKTHEQFYRDRFADYGEVVEIRAGTSWDVLATYPDGHFDMIYVDAGHGLEEVERDAPLAAAKTAEGGLLIFNDYIMYDHLLNAPYGIVQPVNALVVEGGWEVVGFALQASMFCDIALRRRGGDGAAEASRSAALPEAFATTHAALHQARTFALADMPPGAETVLSMGASGRWYFDWFDQAYGRVAKHIGVEAYMPRPDELPDNVEWVDADLASPEGAASVQAGSIDLVFSGQNIEHLWPDQVEAFLVESNRVLRQGGWLVVDSPNCDITSAYQWSMSEHTVEMSPDEARQVLELGGFDVRTMRGVWLCRHHGELLPLEPPATLAGTATVLERMMMAAGRPEDSFIWWAEATKERQPDLPALRRTLRAVFDAHWEERVGRMAPLEGTPVDLDDGRRGVELAPGTPSYGFAGPHMALRPGTYQFTLDVAWEGAEPDELLGRVEVVAADELLALVEIRPGPPEGSGSFTCEATVDRLRFGVHARLWGSGAARLRSPLTMRLDPNPY